MPKALTPKQVTKLLRQNGFLLKRQRGSHRVFSHPETKRRVVISFHPSDLPKGTLHEILKQAGIKIER